MSLPSVIRPLLKKHNLVAFVANEGWVLIRRKSYIDLYIKDEPYSSVEIMYQTESMVKDNIKQYGTIILQFASYFRG